MTRSKEREYQRIPLHGLGMKTHRRCPVCDGVKLCMRSLVNQKYVRCKGCGNRIVVDARWRNGILLSLVLPCYVCFEWELYVFGCGLFFISLILTAGLDLFAVRWFPLRHQYF